VAAATDAEADDDAEADVDAEADWALVVGVADAPVLQATNAAPTIKTVAIVEARTRMMHHLRRDFEHSLVRQLATSGFVVITSLARLWLASVLRVVR
jgi:hypothetical protein